MENCFFFVEISILFVEISILFVEINFLFVEIYSIISYVNTRQAPSEDNQVRICAHQRL